MKNSIFLLVFSLFLSFGCNPDDGLPINEDIQFRQEMRDYVVELASWARTVDPDFIVIPQNGQELVGTEGEPAGATAAGYMATIDGQGREDLFYGYDKDNKATPNGETSYMVDFLDKAKAGGVTILVTDYCSTESKMDDSFSQNQSKGYVSFAADSRELDRIPTHPSPIFEENSNDIQDLSEAQNFLYLINPSGFTSKAAFIAAVSATNYDLLIMDLDFEDQVFTNTEIQQLKTKQNGGTRLVVCYMSIGEAEDYRSYWQSGWKAGNPAWIRSENPNWKGNYKVDYWEKDWQDIIFGKTDTYTGKILEVGFDGVYLDIIDAFEYFEGL